MSVLNVLATCLYMLNREWTLYKRLLTKSWSTLESDYHQQISSIVLICDAKTWSHKKEEKELQWVSSMFWPLDCLNTLNRGWTLYKRLVTKNWPSKESDCHPTNPFLSLKSVKQTWSHKREVKELWWVSWSFWPLNCLYVLNREWTLHKRWVIITQQISSLVVICDAKTRFYRKKGIGNVVSVWNVIRWTESGLYTRDVWLKVTLEGVRLSPSKSLP